MQLVLIFFTCSILSFAQDEPEGIDDEEGDAEGQTMTVVLDTGSSNLWVINKFCIYGGCDDTDKPFKKKKFDTNASSTFIQEDREFFLAYGTGYCFGDLAIDVLSFAGLTVEKQEFGVANYIDDIFGYQPVDGIFGLGWPALAKDKVIPPMQNVLSQLDKPIFTVWMDRNNVQLEPIQGGSGGVITFGDFDLQNCAPTVSWVKLSSLTYWQFPIDGVTFGQYSTKRKEEVISDTGTSFVGAPSASIWPMLRQVGANIDTTYNLYTVACSTMRSLPDLIFSIGGHDFKVPSIEYVLDIGLGNGTCAFTFFDMHSNGFGPAWILGDPWIRSYCNVHDIGEKRIGFAKAIHIGLV